MEPRAIKVCRNSLKVAAVFISRSSLVLSVALALTVPTVAHAYPPGNKISVNLMESMVKPNTSVTAYVTNAKPGNVVITLATRKSSNSVVAGQSGTASRNVSPTKPGVYTVSAFDTSNFDNKATTRLYVPAVAFPKTARRDVFTSITVLYARPGTVVTVTVGSQTFRGTVSATGKASGKAVVRFKVTAQGSNTVMVNLGANQSLVYTKSVTGK